MTTDKPSRNEDEYFARLEAELIAKQRATEAATRAEEERRRHYMKCPKDGFDLATIEQQGVSVDICNQCGGLWLDRGELDQLLSRTDQGILRRVFDDVRTILGRRGKEKE